jgi:hypothetical protein
MPTPANPEQLALVQLAITNAQTTGCFEWIDEAVARMREEPPVAGLTPEDVRSRVYDHVMAGGLIDQRKEERSEYWHRREYWYRVVVPCEGLPRGLFVEMELVDDDPEYPVVWILNAHPQS